MSFVEFGKVWHIVSNDDVRKAMQSLDESEFIAEMSDDYGTTCKEKAEIEKQRKQIMKAASELGFI